MVIRDALDAVRKALVHGERVGRLSEEVADLSERVQAELGELRGEQRELDRRVSRLEGGFAVLNRLQLPPN